MDAGDKHGADHPAGVQLRGRHPPPVVGQGHPALLQPPLRVPAPGLHRVVSMLSNGGGCQTGSRDTELTGRVSYLKPLEIVVKLLKMAHWTMGSSVGYKSTTKANKSKRATGGKKIKVQ